MTPRVVALALLVVAGSVGAARAQAPSPGRSQEAPWSSEAPQECVAKFTAMRSEVEKLGMAARGGSEQRVSRAEMCSWSPTTRSQSPIG
jgi:hypothetical protein